VRVVAYDQRRACGALLLGHQRPRRLAIQHIPHAVACKQQHSRLAVEWRQHNVRHARHHRLEHGVAQCTCQSKRAAYTTIVSDKSVNCSNAC